MRELSRSSILFEKTGRNEVEKNSRPEMLFIPGACISPAENRLYTVIVFLIAFQDRQKEKQFSKNHK